MGVARRTVYILAAVIFVAVSASADLIEKPPDIGPFWQPLSTTGSYVYADCFIAPAVDTTPVVLGTWLEDLGVGAPEGGEGWTAQGAGPIPAGPGPTVRFEIWGDLGPGLGPDAGTILATTGSIDPGLAPGSLEFVSAPVLGTPTDLTPGELYWFAATTVGESGLGSYRFGGHTQNSVFADDCTFWFSNDPAGVVFDGQNVLPEIAFSVETVAPVPTLGTVGLIVLALAVMAAATFALVRRRRLA